MSFVLGKELRVLSVVEFVFFFVSLVQCSCEHEQQQQEKGSDLNRTCSLLSCCSTALCTFSNLVELFGKIVYITVVALLFRDTRVCRSRSTQSELAIAATCVCVKVVDSGLMSCSARTLRKQAERIQQEREQIVQTTPRWALQRVSALQRFGEYMSELDAEREEERRTRRNTWWKRCGWFFIVLYALLWAAMAAFSFSTDIKLAIPESYEASCHENSSVSRVLMFAFPIAALLFSAAEIVGTLGWYLLGLRRMWAARYALELLLVVRNAFGSVLSVVLFARIIKVWRGHELELFEHMALVVGYPLLRNS